MKQAKVGAESFFRVETGYTVENGTTKDLIKKNMRNEKGKTIWRAIKIYKNGRDSYK